MLTICRTVADGLHWDIEEGGRLSAGSVAVITTFFCFYTLALLAGSMVFFRICASLP